MRDDYRHWLQAERQDRDEAAEAALGRLFAALPQPVLPPAFADAVMGRLAMQPVWLRWPLERLAVALLAASAAALWLTPLWLTPVLRFGDLVDWRLWSAPVAVAAAEGVAVLAATLVEAWQLLSELSRFAQQVVQTPQVAAMLAACALLACLSGALLFEILQRSGFDAEPGR